VTFRVPSEDVQHVFSGSQRGAALAFIDVVDHADPGFIQSPEIHSIDKGCELIIKFTSDAVRLIS
jgi:hypothetical protein